MEILSFHCFFAAKFNRFQEFNSAIDKRTVGYKTHRGFEKSTEAMFDPIFRTWS